jgi:hypothetical protein
MKIFKDSFGVDVKHGDYLGLVADTGTIMISRIVNVSMETNTSLPFEEEETFLLQVDTGTLIPVADIAKGTMIVSITEEERHGVLDLLVRLAR